MLKHERLRRHALAGLAACACVTLAVACNRDLTEPSRSANGKPTISGPPATRDARDSPDNVSPTISAADPVYGSSNSPANTTFATYQYPTVVKVVASGYHTRTPNYPFDTVSKWGPSGNAVLAWTDFQNNYTQLIITQGGYVDETATTYATIVGNVWYAGRSGYGARELDGYRVDGYGYVWCGPHANPCDTWSGQTTITLTRLNSDLSLTADSTSVAPGSTVTFTYGALPAVVEGQNMPFLIDSTSWVPDSAASGGEPTESQTHAAATGGCQQINPCRRQIVGSGTFSTFARVNGKEISKLVHVQTPTLSLKANPTGVPVGGMVSFTPSWSDGGSIAQAQVAGWSWAADSTTGATAACAASTSPCRTSVKEAGSMTVRVTRGGVTRTAKVHVSIVSCPFGDTLLDRPEIRQGLKDMWALSGAETQPDIANRAEYMFGAYQDVDGSIFFQQILPAGFPCGVDADVSQIPKTLGTATLVATFHPHPFEWNATYPSNCGSMAGSKYNNADPLTRLGGRASGGDWKTSQVLRTPGYIMDFDGVYRYDGTNARILPVGGTDNYIVTDGMSHYQSWPRVDSTHQCTRP